MKKYWIYIIIGLVALLLVWFFFIRKKSASGSGASDYGTTKTGKPITEAMISKEMAITEGYAKDTITQKASTNGRSYADQLRLDALWMLQNAEGH